MSGVIIVSAFDVEDFANDVARLLGAENYAVRLGIGRVSEHLIPEAKARCASVILVWSRDGYAQAFMRTWFAEVAQHKLIEIMRARSVPDLPRRAHSAQPIDFCSWNGARGGPAWRELGARLRAAERAGTPQDVQARKAANVLAAVSVAAVFGAGALRASEHADFGNTSQPDLDDFVADARDTDSAKETTIQLASLSNDAIGGPLVYAEPLSADSHRFRPIVERLGPLQGRLSPLGESAPLLAPMRFRDPGLIDRVAGVAQSGLQRINALTDDGE